MNKRRKMLESAISAIIANDPAKAERILSKTIIEMARDIHQEMLLREEMAEELDSGDNEEDFENDLGIEGEESEDLDAEETHEEPDFDNEPGFEGEGDGDEDDFGDESFDTEDLDLDEIEGDIEGVEDALENMSDVPTDLEDAFNKLKDEFMSMSNNDSDEGESDEGEPENGEPEDLDNLEDNEPDDLDNESSMDDLEDSGEDELSEAYELKNVPGNSSYGKAGHMGKEFAGVTSLGAPKSNPKSAVAGDANFLNLGEPLKMMRDNFSDPNGTKAPTPTLSPFVKDGGLVGKFRNQANSLETVGKTIEDPKSKKDGRLMGEASKKPGPNKTTKKTVKTGTPIKPKKSVRG